MKLIEILSSINTTGDIAFVVFLILTLVQVAPIKWDPWSKLLRYIGHIVNGEVMDKLNMSEATNSRYRIIRFADEIRCGQKHSEEHFNQIIEDIDEYERYCDVHPDYKNNKAMSAIKSIKNTYESTKKDSSFLI